MIYFKQSMAKFDSTQKGLHPRVADIATSWYLPDQMSKLGISKSEATILVGGNIDDVSKHCLLFRWPNTAAMDQELANNLHTLCQQLSGRHGMEVTRRGGFSGVTLANSNFAVMSSNGLLFPRNREGIKFVQEKVQWTGYYIQTSNPVRNAVKWAYCQPQNGGRVQLKPELVSKELRRYAKVKALSAFALKSIDSNIQPTAVKRMLEMFDKCFAEASGNRELYTDIACKSLHTLIQHPVGYHVDSFSKKQPVLGSKVCFVNSTLVANGRGGAGAGKFVWAIVDS